MTVASPTGRSTIRQTNQVTNDTTSGQSLGGRVASGLRWSMLDAGLQQGMRFVITVLLTRLVAPEDFGVLAMALVFTQLAALIGDLGLGPALVQRPTIERSHIVTASTITFMVGLALTLVLVGLAAPIAHLYGESDLTPVLMVLSLTYLFRGVGGIPRELLRRAMRFQDFVVASGSAVLISGAVGVVLAFSDAGVWALVAQVLIEGAVGAFMAVLLAWRRGVWSPGWGIDKSALQDIGGFGAYVSGTRVAYYGASNIDNFIVGKALGSTALGFYNLAYRLMLFPILKVADVVATVTMPAFASVQHDLARVADAFAKAVQRIGLVCFPVSVGTAIAAPVLVPAVFGEKWTPAVVVVQILAVNGVRLAIGRLNGVVYEATGRPKWDFVMLSITFVAYLVAFLVGVNWGIEGVAWGYTIAGYALVPVDQFLVNRLLGTRPARLLRGLVPVTFATVAMAVVAGAFMLLSDGMSHGAASVAVVALSAITYFGALRLAEPSLLTEFRRDIVRR